MLNDWQGDTIAKDRSSNIKCTRLGQHQRAIIMANFCYQSRLRTEQHINPFRGMHANICKDQIRVEFPALSSIQSGCFKQIFLKGSQCQNHSVINMLGYSNRGRDEWNCIRRPNSAERAQWPPRPKGRLESCGPQNCSPNKSGMACSRIMLVDISDISLQAACLSQPLCMSISCS